MRGWIIGMAICGFSSLANAQPLNAYGFELEKPLTLPECVKVKVQDILYTQSMPNQPTCGMGKTPTTSTMNPADFQAVRFPTSAKPALSKHTVIFVTMIDGNLEGVMVLTRGIETQEDDVAMLSEKYGKPTAKFVVERTLRSGAKVNILNSVWEGADGSMIDFGGAGDKLDEGVLRIRSEKAVKAEASEAERQKSEAAKRSTPL